MALDIQRQTPNGVVLDEMGKDADGRPISLDRRLYLQLLAFGDSKEIGQIIEALKSVGAAAVVLYADLNDPQGIGLLFCHEQPDWFVTDLRQMLQSAAFADLSPKPEFTMFGRTYTIGYEQDLEATLVTTPLSRVTDPKQPWAIWYPLRRKGEFEQLPASEQRTILMEHGGIGRAYSQAGFATDIRLACYGLDIDDNDIVIGLIGKELTPLSKIVERMRRTKQTSQYLESLGPFFVGKALWQRR